RVAINAPQVVLRHGESPVLEQIFQFPGINLRARTLVVVARDGAAELAADEEQLLLLLALRGVRIELAERRQPGAHDGDDDEQAEVGEAALQISRHGPRRSPGLTP